MDRHPNFHDEPVLNMDRLVKSLQKVGDGKYVIISINGPALAESPLLRNVLRQFISVDESTPDFLDTIEKISKNFNLSGELWRIGVSEPIPIRDGGDIFVILLYFNDKLGDNLPFDVKCNVFTTCLLLSSIYIIQTDYMTDLYLQYFSEYTELVRQLARKDDAGNGMTFPQKLMYFVQDDGKNDENELSNQAENSKREWELAMSTTFSDVAVFINTPKDMLTTTDKERLNSALKYFPEGFDDMCFSFETMTENVFESDKIEPFVRHVTRLLPHLSRAAHLHKIRAPRMAPGILHTLPKIIAVNVGMHAYQAAFKTLIGQRFQLVDWKKFHSWHNEAATVALKAYIRQHLLTFRNPDEEFIFTAVSKNKYFLTRYSSILTVNPDRAEECIPLSNLGGRLDRLYRKFMSCAQKYQAVRLDLNRALSDLKRNLRTLADEEYETKLHLLSSITQIQLRAAKNGASGVIAGQKEINLLTKKVEDLKNSVGQSELSCQIESIQVELSRVDENFRTSIVNMLDNIPNNNAVWGKGVLEKLCQYDEPRYLRDSFGKFKVWSPSYTKRQAEEVQLKLVSILRGSVYFGKYIDMLTAHPIIGLSTNQQRIVKDSIAAKEYHSAVQSVIAFWVGKAGGDARIGRLLLVLEQIGWNSAKGKILKTDWSAILN